MTDDAVKHALAEWHGRWVEMEQERDQARASLHEACKVAQSYKVDAYQATERAEAAERERDEWKARADKWHGAWQKSVPARTVTREGVEKAIDGIVPVWDSEVEKIVVALHEMVAGDDPAVFVVRESDVASVSVVKHDVNEWEADGKYAPHADVAAARKGAAEWIAMATRCEAVARAIEAGQAVDPVTEKADELFAIGWPELVDASDDARNGVREGLSRIARHVLGQEAKR